MNETLWNVARQLLVALTMMFILAVIIFLFSNVSDCAHRTQLEQRESQFRAACEEVKGRVAWNGSHWECLK